MTSQACNRINLAREQLEMALVAFLERHRFPSCRFIDGNSHGCISS
ncbi:hypothetical protein [Paraburkholderia elongata]|uniref:Uncharacterized protein n=1 Tax=Paraburkholderia elongata TaxID=2675747 RepID=A0A972NKJ5_9BURK|nr:hypothetical protein [Paraburkholderia elongata]NPT54592.1 hypothetical protein [Paraburkholderia elongata]